MRIEDTNHADAAPRFGSKVQTSDGCWLWTGARNRHGYGHFTLVICGKRVSLLAHRVASLFAHGDLPRGVIVRHRCDVPRCVRLDHLCAGSQADTVRDCIMRGRRARVAGESHTLSKVTVPQVQAIRTRRAAGETLEALGRDYGLTKQGIRAITTRQTCRDA